MGSDAITGVHNAPLSAHRHRTTQVHPQASGQVGPAEGTPPASPASPAQTGEVREWTLGDEPGAARFSIGDTVLREPDYRQILLWAEALGMAPEAVLTTLADPWARGFDLTEEGALVNLVWDFERLTPDPHDLVAGAAHSHPRVPRPVAGCRYRASAGSAIPAEPEMREEQFGLNRLEDGQ